MKSAIVVMAFALVAAAPPSQEETLQRMIAGGPMLDPAELAVQVEAAARHPLGSRDNPVRAAGPPGQRAYLRRLRCADGEAPQFDRAGSFGGGPFGSIMDGYNVTCGEAAAVVIFMDMYHPDHVEAAAVPGFTILP